MSVDGIRWLSTSLKAKEKTDVPTKTDKMLMPEDASTLDTEDMTEMMSRGDMYIRMLNQCWRKCISQYGKEGLSLGEGSCTDRCTIKFAATQKLVEKTLEGVTVFSQKEEARREKFKRRLDEQEAKFKEEQAYMQQPTTQTN